ncbi:ROK family protein [Solirubrobacter phytolaccae]|uniref:ROK family protein n=1 Tax=Solirubrobacter phytolaccae TaxID=1404360 RepID=A0A9X3N7V3_9ACTN|nr:ROK family protein [Solirubrobacter phytolaccae]MDA0180075.1 ROK family protein [Solirubrobacter phytolaccae]
MATIDAGSARSERHADLSRDSLSRVVTALVQVPGMTRAELGARAGLTRSPVGLALAALDDHGFIEQRVEAEGGMGRPPMRIYLAGDAGYSLSLELVDQGLRGSLFDLTGAERQALELPLAVAADPGAVLDAATTLVEDLIAGSQVDRGAVFGVGVVGAGLGDWPGSALATALQQRVELPVQVENDANAGAIGEHRFGAGRGCDDLLYLRLSPTIGIGLIINGNLYRGVSGIAGELGHISLGGTGPLCECGNRGCVEALAGSRAIVGDVHGAAHGDVSTVVRAARAGDRRAQRALTDAATVVGEGLAAAIGLLNPARVVVGGELAAAGPLVMAPLEAAIHRRAFPAAADAARLVVGELGPRAELLGASTLHLPGLAASLVERLLD